MEQDREKELMELRHEPVPGFRTAFFIALAAGVLYLAYVFVFWAGGH